jgi:hemolysin III
MTSAESLNPGVAEQGAMDDTETLHHSSQPCVWWSDKPLSTSMQWYPPPRRQYSRRALKADRFVNFLGAGLAWLAALVLALASGMNKNPLSKQFCFWLHGAGLITMLNCSAFYHLWAWDKKHTHRLLSLDHIGISAMIVGCYAPFMQACDSYKVLTFVCLSGVAVFPLEALRIRQAESTCDEGPASAWSAYDKFHIVRYLVMGWSCLVIAPTLMRSVPPLVLYVAVAGGLFYTSGVFFFVTQKLEFHLAIWHTLVLLASMLFYIGNMRLVFD